MNMLPCSILIITQCSISSLQAGLAASMGGDLSTPSATARSSVGDGTDDENVGTLEELQDRVIQLEQELVDVQERYEEQLEMEKVRDFSRFFLPLVSTKQNL